MRQRVSSDSASKSFEQVLVIIDIIIFIFRILHYILYFTRNCHTIAYRHTHD